MDLLVLPALDVSCMPLDMIQQMINICQGLNDLQGIAMPHNYVSANVTRGKAINQDQPNSNSTLADSPMQIIHFDFFGQGIATAVCLLLIILYTHGFIL